jgi:hypothetical protein
MKSGTAVHDALAVISQADELEGNASLSDLEHAQPGEGVLIVTGRGGLFRPQHSLLNRAEMAVG